MEFIKYEIKRGDTLESIALEYSLNVTELINFHNLYCGTTNFIIGNKLPIHLQYLLLEKKTEEEKNEAIEKKEYQKKARYRCEQFNTTKVEDRISFHCNTKKEYTVERNFLEGKARIKLKEYLYKINPDNLGLALEAVKDLEFDKENVVFDLNNDNTIKKVVNFLEIKGKWENFKPKLAASEFYRQVEKINSKAAEDIIKGGQLEFESESNLRKTYDKSLLYHVLFNDFDAHKKRDKNDILKFISQIFVNIPLEIELQHTIIKEDDYFVEYRTVGTLLKDKIDNTVLEEQYNKFYKPIIEYSFSEYNYDYRIRRMVDKKTGVIVNASALMKEEVKNNYQFITQFDLKQIDY
ncbi:LysM peptidoglycan-binding domain-containing protein [Chryseobacterium sp. Ch-15]|uniref:LysM peptidoglycan-binding domain-containing protein n=1 Tax=Chryseobacterium muglaense TaxID=2893752 RepID=A0A9Q3UYL1_9FLAO|nr:LysM peptidoglycan-binding domain-containing protein [Chryseobacterium muglaense]MBD3907184.1 LysM peptidoglycan-binding domain-containing protein [Chryseobacterium muglaense]MCC9036363.1 LysM peptidoglycan-binding domain-containing protein [Chryseobacterium muglaense]MCM2556458.1 LysM peptidoglycan-binding domain-containing protein [Chryseobacterium muglaense]